MLILLLLGWGAALLTLKFSEHSYTPVTAQQKVEAMEYLGDQITATPSAFKWSMFEAEQGVELRSGLLEADDSKGTVIVVPGFTGSIEMIMREIVMINQAGFRVATLEYRGQGMSYRPLSNHPEKGYVEDYSLLGNDLAKYANSVKHKGEPLFFFSISKGAHITMRMAAMDKVDVDAYALIVPMIQINSGELSYQTLKTVAAGVTTMGLGSAYAPGGKQWPGEKLVFGEANGCNANPETAQAQSALFALNEKLRTRSVTFKWLYETTRSTEKLMNPEYVAAITQPVKIYTAGIDELVSTNAANQFCKNLAQCSTQHYPESRHCITREYYDVYDEIVKDAIAHFEAVLSN